MYTKKLVQEKIDYYQENLDKLNDYKASREVLDKVVEEKIDECRSQLEMWKEELGV